MTVALDNRIRSSAYTSMNVRIERTSAVRARRITTPSAVINSALRAHEGEQHGLPDARPGEHHQQSVDTHSHTTGGRHRVLQRAQEVFIQLHGLRVSAGGEQGLRSESKALLSGVDQLG